jgi:FkbM family methyltransferase
MSASAPSDLLATFRRSVALVRTGRYAEALPDLERIAASNHFPYAPMILRFARFCADGNTITSFEHAGESFRFGITAANLGLDMFLVAGRFFEQDELDYCRSHVPPGGTIVDVGANVGNHAVYFGRFLRPATLIPIEPNPAAVTLLKNNLALNGIAADERGFGLALHDGQDLVVGRLAGEGDVPVLPLDELIDGPVSFLKIDVEGMELDVLAGARRILAEDRPLLFVEVQSTGLETFRTFCRDTGYIIDKSFPASGYANHFLRPA